MRVELTARHMDITPALRRMVDGKLAKLDRMLNDSAVSAQVVLTREKRGHRTDLSVHTRGEKFLHAMGGPAAAWSTSISEAVDKIAQQALRIKGKWLDRKRQGGKGAASEPEGRRAAARVRPAAPAPVRASARVRLPPIVSTSRQTIREMSLADAAREVEANGEGVLVFRDAETAAINVLYRRASGELTLVQTGT